MIPAIASTAGRLHCEFVRLLLFFQAHRETDRFLTASGVQLEQTNYFHFLRTAFSSQLKSKVDNILANLRLHHYGLS